MKKIILIIALALVFAGGFHAISAQAAPLNLTGWAWTSTMGWLSFSSTNAGAGGGTYGVSAATSTLSPNVASLSGYAWGAIDDNGKPSGIGWVSFSSANTGCPATEASFDKPVSQGGTGADLPSGVSNICAPRVDLNTGKVSGWARILNMAAEDASAGWLHLSGTNHQTGAGGVSYNKTTGAFSGKAWEPSALGWLDFSANVSPGSGVVICVTGTPGCPPVTYTPTCSIGTIFVSGNDVMIPINLPSGATWYKLLRDGSEVDRSKSSDTIVDSGLALIPGTYTYQIVKSSDGVACGNPVVFTIVPPPPSGGSGVRLMIDTPSATFSSSYDDSLTTQKSLRVVKGSSYKLKWNINPANVYNDCTYVPPPGFTFTGGTSSGSTGALSTASVNTGTYNFTITCTSDTRTDSSSARLYVVSSSLEEI